MARKHRVLVPNGWYHVMNRGNRQETIFRTDDDRRRFCARLSELPERFRVEVHAFVLMDNHYHLLLRTRDPNLSDAIRWLQVAYASVHNWAHRMVGHVFQGRFHAVLIEDLAGVVEVARYLHLNPVRVDGLGLGKAEQRRAKVADLEDPGAELVRRRLEVLDEFRWSSWRVYGGRESRPAWLDVDVIGPSCGGRSRKDQREALRVYTEGPVRQGRLDRPWDRVIGRCVLGSEEYARAVMSAGEKADEGSRRMDGTGARRVEGMPRVPWHELVSTGEKVSGRSWHESVKRHGEWLREGILHVAVRYQGYRLAEVYREVPELSYAAAAQALRRFERAMVQDAARRKFVDRLRKMLGKEGDECQK